MVFSCAHEGLTYKILKLDYLPLQELDNNHDMDGVQVSLQMFYFYWQLIGGNLKMSWKSKG